MKIIQGDENEMTRKIADYVIHAHAKIVASAAMKFCGALEDYCDFNNGFRSALLFLLVENAGHTHNPQGALKLYARLLTDITAIRRANQIKADHEEFERLCPPPPDCEPT